MRSSMLAQGGGDDVRVGDRYRLFERIGRGGMGEVWKGVDEQLGRRVAVKLLRRHLRGAPQSRDRFFLEMRRLALVEHPRVARLYDVGAEPQLFMVMQLVRGITLREMIRNEGCLEPNDAVCFAIELAEALGAIHAAKLVHRDIKPDNVMITEERHVSVIDFGIAHHLAAGPPGEVTDRLGTLGYVTPEMARGEPPEARSDFFQLGVVLYEMLSGRKPWSNLEGASESEVQAAHAFEEPDPIREIVPACSAALEAVVLKLLAKEASARYANADEIVKALRATLPPAKPADASPAVDREILRSQLSSLVGEGPARGEEETAEEAEKAGEGEAAISGPIAIAQPRQESTDRIVQRETLEIGAGYVAQSPVSPSALAAAVAVQRPTVSVLPGALRALRAPFPLAQPRAAPLPAPIRTVEVPAAQVPAVRWPFPPAKPRRRAKREWGRVRETGRKVLKTVGVALAVVLAGSAVVLVLVLGAQALGVRVVVDADRVPVASAAAPPVASEAPALTAIATAAPSITASASATSAAPAKAAASAAPAKARSKVQTVKQPAMRPIF
jgi:serine/threonine-protein kinase